MINKINSINLFTNNYRSINILKSLLKVYKIKNIFLAKRYLDSKLINYLNEKRIKYLIIDNTNHPKVIQSIKRDNVINIVCGFPYIFPKNLLIKSKYPIINCHGGNLPNYRGASPLSWQIINKEKKIYISTLVVSEGIDDGKIIQKKSFKLKKNMNIQSVQNKANTIFPKLVLNSIKILLDKKKLKNQTGKIKIYKQRHPVDSFFVPNNIRFLELYNLHRGTFPLYCPPFYFDKSKIVFIEKFKKIKSKINDKKIKKNNIFLAIKDANIIITKYKIKKII